MSVKVVTAAVIQRANLVLICKRKIGEALAGYWEFPGGKLESNESLRDCLKRELLEELNINSSVSDDIFCEVIHSYEKGKIKLIAIRAELLEEPISSMVHDEIAWVEIDSLLSYKLAPADIPIAKKLMESK
jgi:8-oxo-dGTP diphosphatase